MSAVKPTLFVIPAKAGIQCARVRGRERVFWLAAARLLDPRFRGDDR